MNANFVGEEIGQSFISVIFIWSSRNHKEITVPTEDEFLNLFVFLDYKVVDKLLPLVKER